jgi:SH3-like domain-containing protein
LAKDTVVAVGRSENGFRAVQLPLGPLGFVSKKFAEVSPDGVVKTKGSKVAFRYRARSSEAPVNQLDDGTTLQVIGEQDDWFRVRVAGVEAWVAEADVQVGDPADPALAKAWAELQAKHAAEVKARLDAIAAQRAREAQDAADLAAVQVVTDAFAEEKKKDVADQTYEPLVTALDKLKGTVVAESAAVPAIDALKKRIETQKWIVEANALRTSKAPVVDAPPPEVKDPLEKFQSIGWLRYERRLAGPGIYFLEKGGQRLYVLSCTNGRYDLGLFVDHEVAIGGPRRRPVAESLSVLDIERLEVLGTPIK